MHDLTIPALRVAIERINDPEQTFEFRDWKACAVGHIWAGVNGETAKFESQVLAVDGDFADVVLDVALALGYRGENHEHAAIYVSDLTYEESKHEEDYLRDAAVVVLGRALEFLLEAQAHYDLEPALA